MTRARARKGRPDLQGSMELDLHLMATAAKLFLEQGYEGTSMDQIAAAAGAGKQSLYRRYANKEALFKVVFTDFVMKDLMTRSDQRMADLVEGGACRDEACLEDLCQLAHFVFSFMLEPDTVEGLRLFVAERRRFPELSEEVRRMTESLREQITQLILAAQRLGRIRSDVSPLAPLTLIALVAEGPIFQALLGLPSVSTPAKRAAYFESAWETFMASVAPPPQSTVT